MNYRNTAERAAIVDTMVELLEKGLPLTAVCQRVGISYSLVGHWKRWARGADGQPPREEYIELVRKLSLAQAKSAERQIDRMLTASEEGDVTATKWLLARLHPQWFGPDAKQERLEVEDAEDHSEDKRIIEAYTAPDRLHALAEMGEELGLCRHAQELARLKQGLPVRTAPSESPEGQVQRAADALRGALAFGARPVRDTAQRIVQELGCEPEHVAAAADMLNLETLQPTDRTDPVWKLPGDPKRTTPNVGLPDEDEGRDEGSTDIAATAGSEVGRGVGDFLRRRR